jgi:hypothetical protein
VSTSSFCGFLFDIVLRTPHPAGGFLVSIFNVSSQLETHSIIPPVSGVSKEQTLKGEGWDEGEKEVFSMDYIPLPSIPSH